MDPSFGSQYVGGNAEIGVVLPRRHPGFTLIELLVVIPSAESHRWVVPDTVRPAREGGVGGGFDAVPPTDYEWLRQRSSLRR